MTQHTKATETDEELDYHFSGMITWSKPAVKSPEWIVDSGASDHMTPHLHLLSKIESTSSAPRINLPNGDTAAVSHTGKAYLHNDLLLDNVLYISHFKHNLLSVQRLIKDNKCEIKFYPTHCDIVDTVSLKVYYLSVDNPLPAISNASVNVSMSTASNSLEVWHNKLGHAPIQKIKIIPHLSIMNKNADAICLTCPMARFTKPPFPSSTSLVARPFDLVLLDIWGPYKEVTRGNCRYFFTMVDDHTRYTWIYLLKLKSDSLDTLK